MQHKVRARAKTRERLSRAAAAEPYVLPKPVAEQGQTFLSNDHELICLTYEEALKRGFEAEYGKGDDGGYWIEIKGCKLDDLSKILKAAEDERKRIGDQLNLWNRRDSDAAREAA